MLSKERAEESLSSLEKPVLEARASGKQHLYSNCHADPLWGRHHLPMNPSALNPTSTTSILNCLNCHPPEFPPSPAHLDDRSSASDPSPDDAIPGASRRKMERTVARVQQLHEYCRGGVAAEEKAVCVAPQALWCLTWR